MTDDKQRFTIATEVLYQQIGDEVVLLHMDSGRYYGLDEVGARFWELMTESDGSPEATISSLLAEFEVDEATLRADLQRLLLELTDANLLLPAT